MVHSMIIFTSHLIVQGQNIEMIICTCKGPMDKSRFTKYANITVMHGQSPHLRPEELDKHYGHRRAWSSR